MTISATYTAADRTLRLMIGSTISSQQCTAVRTDRTVSMSFVGRAMGGTVPNFNGNIAGIYAVDALLSAAEISVIEGRMQRGEDALHAAGDGGDLGGAEEGVDCVQAGHSAS